MLDHHHVLPPRQHLLIAGAVGLLLAALTFVRITLPIWPFFAQFAQFSPPERLTLLVKLLSPLLSFLLASGWVLFLLWIGDLLLARPSTPPPNQSFVHDATTPAPATQEGERNEVSLTPLPPQEEHVFPLEEVEAVAPIPKPPAEHLLHVIVQQETSDQEEEHQASTTPVLKEPSVIDLEPDNGEQSTTTRADDFSLHVSSVSAESHPPLTMTLLKQVRVWLSAQDGTRIEVKLRGGENCLRLLIFAYITWRQGVAVDRDKLLTHVIARGKRADFDSEQLSGVFDGAKKFLRQDLDRAVRTLEEAGHPVETPLDFFSNNEPGFYQLHASCKIIDLADIDHQHSMLLIARKQGLLDEKIDGSLPPWVTQACTHLIGAYSGDFLQSLLEKYPDEFGAWVREPLTLYRDKYLDALLTLANYESALGRNFEHAQMDEEKRTEHRRAHMAKAAQHFYDYAMHAINNPWDTKLTFAYRKGRDGERVIMAARALRRCVVELGKLGKSEMIDQVYLAFKLKMAKLSDGHWEPDQDTKDDVAEAKKTTGAYRFTSQVRAVMGQQEQSGT